MSEMKRDHPTIKVLGEYLNNRTHIPVRCTVCGHEWSPLPSSLYLKHGCPKCNGCIAKTHEEFVREMAVKHPDLIVLGTYVNNHTNILMKCKDCGYEWKASPNALSRRATKGCPKCYGRIRRTTEECQEIISNIYPNIKIIGEYINKDTSVECYCENCGKYFFKIPHSIISQESGCPYCSDKKKSKGENKIENWLDSKNIHYIHGHPFDDCKDLHVLPFDFYLPEFNTIIEYDGKQHYMPIEHFGGEEGLKYTQRHDKIKNDYCITKNINLIRIPYWDYNEIDNILEAKLVS